MCGSSNLLVICMSSFVVFAIPNGGEFFVAMTTLIRLFASVCAHMYQKVSFFSEDLATIGYKALEEVLT